MDYFSLCEDLYKWKENKEGAFQGGRLIWDCGPFSIIEPAEDPSCIIKVIRPNLKPIYREFKNLFRLNKKGIGSEAFVIPKPIACGLTSQFHYLVMSNLGPDYAMGQFTVEKAEIAGKAAAAFSDQLLELDGSLHNDLGWRNLTTYKPGIVGVIDIDSIEPAAEWIKMFRAPLVQAGNFIGYMALEFTRRRAHKMPGFMIDIDRLLEMSRKENWPARAGWEYREGRSIDAEVDAKIRNNLLAMGALFKANGMERYLSRMPK